MPPPPLASFSHRDVVSHEGCFLTAAEVSLDDERVFEIAEGCLLTTFVLKGKKPSRGGKRGERCKGEVGGADVDGGVDDEEDDDDSDVDEDEEEDNEEAAALRALGLPVSFGTTRASYKDGGGISGGGSRKGGGRRRKETRSPPPRHETQLRRSSTSPPSPHVKGEGAGKGEGDGGGSGRGRGRSTPPSSLGENELLRRAPAPPDESSAVAAVAAVAGASSAYRPPYYGPPPHEAGLSKFFARRDLLWGRREIYESGILMDDVGWYSVTPFELAARHATRLISSPSSSPPSSSPPPPSPPPSPPRTYRRKLVLDAFAGVGGDTAALSAAGAAVVAVDSCAPRLEAARHNAELVCRFLRGGDGDGADEELDVSFGPRPRRLRPVPLLLDLVAADFFSVAPSLNVDAVFMSPPWGGGGYSERPVFDASEDVGGLGVGVAGLLSAAAEAHAPGAPLDVAVFLPRSTRLIDLVDAARGIGVSLEVERAVCRSTNVATRKKNRERGGGRRKTLVGITAYFGASARKKEV